MILLMDNNLEISKNFDANDSLHPNFSLSSQLNKLFDKQNNFVIDNNIIIHYKGPTYIKYKPHSKIDHLYFNCPGDTNNGNSINTECSDHYIIT